MQNQDTEVMHSMNKQNPELGPGFTAFEAFDQLVLFSNYRTHRTPNILHSQSPPTNQPILASNDDEFSRANVFGLFLTLGVCLLLQPYGSLIYIRPSTILGRVVFFFWRLNPLACFIETVLVCLALVESVATAIGHKVQCALSHEYHHTNIWADLRITTTAIHQIRGQHPWHWPNMISNQEQEEEDASDSHLRYRDRTSVSTTPNDDERMLFSAFRDDDDDDASSVASSRDIVGSPTLSSPLLPPEDALPSSSNMINSLSAERTTSFLIGAPPTYRTILSAGMAMDILSTLGTLVVVTKLAVIHVPLHVALAAWFMVSGWASVQLLIITSHRGITDIGTAKSLLYRIEQIEGWLSHPILWVLLSVSLAPVFGYLAYIMLFRSSSLPIAMPLVFLFLGFLFFAVCGLLRTDGQDHSQPASRAYKRRSALEPSACTKTVRWLLNLLVACVAGNFIARASLYCVLYPRKIDRVPAAMAIASWSFLLWAWFFYPSKMFASQTNGRNGEWIRSVSLLYNLLTVGFLLAGALITYAATGTYKPGWLDWLGKF